MEKLNRTILSVITGKYEAGVIRLDALNSMEMMKYKKGLRIISKSEKIPQYPFLIKKDIGKDLIVKITTALTNLSKKGDKSSESILKNMQIKR
jgi:ABC-type phosphate/phosphonate transport system substrate-binding protein